MLCFIIGYTVSAKSDYDVIENNNYLNIISQHVYGFLENNVGENFYDYIGGISISDDSNSINLYISDKKKINSKLLNDLFLLYGKVNILNVKKSYNELLNQKNIIHKSLINDSNYTGSYIDVDNNSIIIEVKNISLALPIQIEDNSYIKVVENTFINYASYIHPGQKIMTKFLGYCSVGFRSRVDGENGYVTAGHCTSGLGGISPQGVVTRYKNFGNADYAFIKTNGNYILTNNLKYSGDDVHKLAVSNNCPFIYTNTIVAKSGYSTYYTSGKIYTTSYSVNIDGVDFYNLICAHLKSKEGDSGGPIFRPDSSGGEIYGILKGGSNDHTSTCFTSINNIDSDIVRGRY